MTDTIANGRPPYAPADLDQVCVTDGDLTLTWREWNQKANKLANSLGDLGLGSGDRVAVRMRTRIEWLITSLAISKLEGVIVAVNYRLSPPEAHYIAKDCEVRAAIIDDADPAELVNAWADLDLKAVVSLSATTAGTVGFDELIEQGDDRHRPAERLAPLVIYSSGTTGAPKGAPLGRFRTDVDLQTRQEYQRSVLFDYAAGGPGNKTLINIPMHHGAGPSYTEFALMTGGTVVFQRKFGAEETLALIQEREITHWIAVPTMLQRVFNLPAEVRKKYDTSSIRFLMGGAAPFSAELKTKVLDYFGDVLYEIYGATECGMVAGATPEILRDKPSATGRVFRHVAVRIIDHDGTDVAPGATGEIAVKSPNVITGYIGRGPLSGDHLTSDGYYRTGDVGRIDEDGILFISDRITDMIIAGGVNIYPAEIEAVIGSHPEVAHVAVIGVPDPDHGEQPRAYVQLNEGSELSAEDVLTFCNGKLAKYKWPRTIEFIEEIPTNPMGKFMKRALRDRYVTEGN